MPSPPWPPTPAPQDSPYAFDAFAWPRDSTNIGMNMSDGGGIAEVAKQLEDRKADPTRIVGIFTNSREQVVSIVSGTEQQFRLLNREQLREFARAQGGSRLHLHAKAESPAQAHQTIEKFEEMNHYSLLWDMVVEFRQEDGSTAYISAKESGTFKSIPEFFGGQATREQTKIVQYSPHLH